MLLMDKLMNEFNVKYFILWGRSMGAVTALMISTKYSVNIYILFNFIKYYKNTKKIVGYRCDN